MAALLIEGFSRPAIAAQLNLALPTIDVHVKHLYQKLSVENQALFVRRLIEHALELSGRPPTRSHD